MYKTLSEKDRKRYTHPHGYWPAFMVFSIFVHIIGYGIFTDSLRTFLDSLPDPLKFTEIMEVELVTSAPEYAPRPPAAEDTPATETKPAEPPVKGPKDKPVAPPPPKPPVREPLKDESRPKPKAVKPVAAPEPQKPVEQLARKEPPPKPETVEPVARKPEMPPEPPPLPDVPPKVDYSGNEPRTVQINVRPLVHHETPDEDMPEDDTVMVIRRNKSETVQVASIPAVRSMPLENISSVPAPAAPSPAAPPAATRQFAPLTSLITRVMSPMDLQKSLLHHDMTDFAMGNPDLLASINRDVSAAALPHPLAHTSVPHRDMEYTPAQAAKDGTGVVPPAESQGLTDAVVRPAPRPDDGRIPIRVSLPLPKSLGTHSIPMSLPLAKSSDEKKKAGIVLLVELPSLPEPGPEVDIESPDFSETDVGLIALSGTASGKGVTSVLISMGNTKKEMLLNGDRFSTSIPLLDGRNVIVATVEDASGRQARDRKVVSYNPPVEAPEIFITNPLDGDVIDTEMTGRVTVTGTVDGAVADVIRLYVNSDIYTADVNVGMFSAELPVVPGENTVIGEASDIYGRTSRSGAVRFTALNTRPKDLVVLVKYNEKPGSAAIMTSWKPHPFDESRTGPDGSPSFHRESSGDGMVIDVEDAVPGIYTIGLEYDNADSGQLAASFEVTLFGGDPDKRRRREIGPLDITGRGYIPAVRVLLPEGVFWEDDNYFTGKLEKSDETIKFRQPEGIIWKEKN